MTSIPRDKPSQFPRGCTFVMSDIPEKHTATESSAEDQHQGELINASGHKQELERNFSLLSICAVAVTTGNTWIAQGGSVAVALYNGGLAGTIYELYDCVHILH